MTAFEPHAVLAALLAAVQEGATPGLAAAEAAARPEVVARGLRFLAAAYSVVWAVLGAYVVILSFRLRRVARQVRRIRERLGL